MAPSALGTAYERIFGWNIELSRAALCALNRKTELLEDKFLPSVNRHVQSSVLQPSEKAKELVELPDGGTSYPHHRSRCDKAFPKSAFEISVLRESIQESNSYFCKKCKIKGSNGTAQHFCELFLRNGKPWSLHIHLAFFFQSQVDTRDKSEMFIWSSWHEPHVSCARSWAVQFLCESAGSWDQCWINYTRHPEFHITISKHPPGVLCDFQQ